MRRSPVMRSDERRPPFAIERLLGMNDWSDLVTSHLDSGATAAEVVGGTIVGSYGDAQAEYEAVVEGPALVDRSYRGLLEVTGSDRASWLHNLTTNHVEKLKRGEGNYAFATNVQGRILFDLHVLVRADSIWVDLDRRFLSIAKPHFEKYIITEDVCVVDRSDEFVRLGLVGQHAALLLTDLGIRQATAMPRLGMAEMSLGGTDVVFVRHNFCGPFGVELFVCSEVAVRVWRTLTDSSIANAAQPAGYEAVQIHRIESGIPWPGHEITDDVLPAETNRLEQAVSFDKGCYLGQEVVERMRSRDVVARRLVGLQFDGDAVVPCHAALLTDDGNPVGHVTSACRCLARPSIIGLGYVKTAYSQVGRSLRVTWDDAVVAATVAKLPLVPMARC